MSPSFPNNLCDIGNSHGSGKGIIVKAMTVIDVATLHEQAERTMARADAHSEQVKGIMLALLGGMVWRGEPGSVEFKNHDGGPMC